MTIVQPFVLFEKKFIARLRQMQKLFLVTQTYHRATGLQHSNRKPVLITDYDDEGLAEIHYKAVKDDPYAAIIKLRNKKHEEKLLEMLGENSPYVLFWSVVEDAATLEQFLNRSFAANIRRYIEKNTNWRIGGSSNVSPSFEITFGELFITLKWNAQRKRIKFEDIENA